MELSKGFFAGTEEEIEHNVLEEVAKILKVPVDAIKKLDDAKTINIVSKRF